MTCVVRQPVTEDDFDERQPPLDEDLHCKASLDGGQTSMLLPTIVNPNSYDILGKGTRMGKSWTKAKIPGYSTILS